MTPAAPEGSGSSAIQDVARHLVELIDRSPADAFYAVADGLDRVVTALRAAIDHLTAYLHALGFPTQSTPIVQTSPPTPPSDPDTEARHLFTELPPRSPRDKTRGLWVDDHGEKHHLISGEHEDWYRQANQRAADIGIIPRGRVLSIASHVEIKFAMRMHAETITRATIVVNKTPCERDFGCHELLPQFLPEGAELTVYGPGGFRHSYHGRRRPV